MGRRNGEGGVIPLLAVFLAYTFGGVVFVRATGAAKEDGEVAMMMGLFWPMFLAVGAVIGVGLIVWRITDLPAAVLNRAAEWRTLRRAERAQRMAEARRLLAAEGLDFNP